MTSELQLDYEENYNVPVLGDPEQVVSTVLTIPPALYLDEFKYNLPPATRRLIIFLHGIGAHKNFGFQPELVRTVTKELGVYTARFDFRGCGDSSPGDPQARTLEQDVEDLDSVIEFFSSGGHQGTPLNVDVICGHSRGVIAMFNWALRQQTLKKPQVYNLINLAGRFDGRGYERKALKTHPDYKEKGGFNLSGYVNGRYRDVWCSLREIESVSSQDMNKVANLDGLVQVLNVYGSVDEVIPPEDKYSYEKVLGKRGKLVVIDKANHNFFGCQVYDDPNSPDYQLRDGNVIIDNKPYPLKRSRKAIDYSGELTKIVLDWLSPEASSQRFYESSLYIDANTPRWINVDGLSNVRDLGGWKTINGDKVRSRLLFRCADPGRITDSGIQTLHELKIKAVFDLRSHEERDEVGSLEIPGATNFHVPAFDANLSPLQAIKHYVYLLTSWSTYLQVYKDVLESGVEAFKTVFEFLRDHPDEPIVFHCTAGKDRTGVAGMLILLLAGVDPWIVAREYELTAVGLKPDHDTIRSKFFTALKKMPESDSKTRLIQGVVRGRANWDFEEDGFQNLISSRYEALRATIDWVNEHYGGVEKYLSDRVGLQDVDLVRAHLLAPKPSITEI